MLTNDKLKAIVTSVMVVTLLTNTTTATKAQQLSKTPNLSIETTLLEPIDPIKMPDDYPQDLLDFYNSNVDARSYIVVDAQTQRIVAERQGNQPYPIASMTKILPFYLVLEAIDEGKLKLDDEIKIHEDIQTYFSDNIEMSSAGLVSDVSYTVEDLIYGMMLASGNDATSALMWHLFGNEQDAVQMMIDLVHSFDITNFELYTTSGIPNKYIPEKYWMPNSNEFSENKMSAADVALIAQHLVEDYPDAVEFTSVPDYTAAEDTEYERYYTNPNLLLPDSMSEYARIGMDGLKSGYTDDAGKNFVAHTHEKDRELYIVSMGLFGPEEYSSYWEIDILLDGLLEYPELYDNEDLPTNTRLPLTDLAEETETQEDEQKTKEIEYENNRDNLLTNIMRDIFNIFRK